MVWATNAGTATLLDLLNIKLPILQAPMAGVSSPDLAAAVSEARRLGAIGVDAAGVEDARTMIAEVQARTAKPFNVNVFAQSQRRAGRRAACSLGFERHSLQSHNRTAVRLDRRP